MKAGKGQAGIASAGGTVAAVCSAVCLFWGCATEQEIDVSSILKSIDKGAGKPAQKYEGPDAPDTPVSGMPPPTTLPGAHVERKAGEITIQPDCLVQINVEEDGNLSGTYPVNDIGAVELGYIGAIILYNKTEKEAERQIRERLISRDFRNATVTVKIVKASYDKIMVVGAVGKAGEVRIGAGDAITLNDALRRAGGLRTSVKGAKVKVIRKGLLTPFPTALEGEEYGLETAEGKPSIPDVKLSNNDVVNVFSGEVASPEVGGDRDIMVVGAVPRPGIVRFSPGEQCTVMYLFFKIGGLPQYADKKKVKLVRRGEDGQETETIIDVEKILSEGKPEDDKILENGDRIVVPARRLTLF